MSWLTARTVYTGMIGGLTNRAYSLLFTLFIEVRSTELMGYRAFGVAID